MTLVPHGVSNAPRAHRLQVALEQYGDSALAARYQALAATMATAAPILFRKTNGQVASGATIVDHTVAASTANRQTSGSLGDHSRAS